MTPHVLLALTLAAEVQMVGGTSVNMRAAPDTKAAVTARLPFGARVDAGETKGIFRAVQVLDTAGKPIAGMQGYMAASLLRPTGEPLRAGDKTLVDSLVNPEPCNNKIKPANCESHFHPEEFAGLCDAKCDKRRLAERDGALERIAYADPRATGTVGGPEKALPLRAALWSGLVARYQRTPALLRAIDVWHMPAPRKPAPLKADLVCAAAPLPKAPAAAHSALRDVRAVATLAHRGKLTLRTRHETPDAPSLARLNWALGESTWQIKANVPTRTAPVQVTLVADAVTPVRTTLSWGPQGPYALAQVPSGDAVALAAGPKAAAALGGARVVKTVEHTCDGGMRTDRHVDIDKDGTVDFVYARGERGEGCMHEQDVLLIPDSAAKSGWAPTVVFAQDTCDI